MDIDFSVEVKHTWVHEKPYKVTLTRGASGQYRWEIEVRDETPEWVLDRIEQINTDLCHRYGGLEPPEEEG